MTKWLPQSRRNRALLVLAAGALAVLVVAIGGSATRDAMLRSPGSGSSGLSAQITGTFVSWQAVDDANGYASFTVTNRGTASGTAHCTVEVRNDFGDFGFDSLVGETVAPGQTIPLRMAIGVGKGSRLINKGNVKNC